MDVDAILVVATELGYERVSPEQWVVIESFLEGQDVFVSLPTGTGKSLCYWVLPGIFDWRSGKIGSIVVVVIPLRALMLDQIVTLTRKEQKQRMQEKLQLILNY